MTKAEKESIIQRDSMMSEIDEFYIKKSPYERMVHLLRYATLAPSTHNCQPWLFDVCDNKCRIFWDERLKLPQADPEGRDAYVSLGCCLKNLEIVGKYFRVLDTIDDRFGTDDNCIEVEFNNLMSDSRTNSNYSEFVKAIIYRQNSRGIFSTELPPPGVDGLNIMDDINIHIIRDRERIRKFAELTAEGLRMAYQKIDFRREMAKWVIPNYSKRNEGIPGYSLRFPTLFSIIFPYLIQKVDIGEKVSRLNLMSVGSSPAVAIFTAKENNPSTWIKLGMVVEEFMLRLQTKNIRTSIFLASIEMGDLYKGVQTIVDTSDRPQFSICFGEMLHAQGYTRRHPIENKLLI